MVDSECLHVTGSSAMEIFEKIVLIEKPDASISRKVRYAVTVLLKGIHAIDESKRKMLWDAQTGVSPTKNIPLHITHFLSNRYKDLSLFWAAKHFPLSKRPVD